MGLIKGTAITNVRAFITGRFGPRGWNELLSLMPSADREPLTYVLPATWYDLGLYTRLVRTACSHLNGGPHLALDLGRFSAERDLSTRQRWFLKLTRPSVAFRDMTSYWRRINSTGAWETEISEELLRLRLTAFGAVDKILCLSIAGYLETMLRLFGGRVDQVCHRVCRCQGEAVCEFTAQCRLNHVPKNLRPCSRGDMASIARELLEYTDLDQLVDAIQDFLRLFLRCSWMSLWVESPQDGGEVLLRASGEENRGKRSCLLLPAQGRVVGRLEIDAPAGYPGDSELDFLDGLLPFFAIALENVLLTSSARAEGIARAQPEQNVSSSKCIATLLREAQETWSLTPRQTEVLELVIQGQSNKEIACALGCQESTVELHVSHILRKCCADTRAVLVARFWSQIYGLK